MAIRNILFVMALVLMTGCDSLSKLSGSSELPSGAQEPNFFQTEAGALAFYRDALAAFEGKTVDSRLQLGGFITAMISSGLLSDELQVNTLGGTPTDYFNLAGAAYSIDARQIPERSLGGNPTPQLVVDTYNRLQQIRGAALQGIGALRKYAPKQPVALTGHLYAIAGYAEVLLADLFCSGIPLSTLDFEADFTYKPGSKTDDVYLHAIALFDTALTLSNDSSRIVNLARVGKGRALLNVRRFADARAAVQDVPNAFVYQFTGTFFLGTGLLFGSSDRDRPEFTTVADREGAVGFPYVSGLDPRTAVVPAAVNQFSRQLYGPTKYAQPTALVTVANGIEARLIEAEAELQISMASNAWLQTLNALRTDGTFVIGSNNDTLWNPGIGGVSGLAPIKNPGTTENARLKTLFDERAAWLFLTVHRLGDLRRLVRNYNQRQQDVFPSGTYLVAASLRYGTDANMPIPESEYANPFFTGCIDRSR